MDDQNDRYPEVLRDVADHATMLLSRRGLSADAARELGRELAEFLREHWGGQRIYIPMGVEWELSERDRKIFSEFNGRNQLELCRKYGLSEERLRQIIRAVRAEHYRRKQRGLF